jgi:hypothetical protein
MTVEKGGTNNRAIYIHAYVILKKLHKVNNLPEGENSLYQVTLLTSQPW